MKVRLTEKNSGLLWHFLTLATVLFFVIIKIPFLNFPYFWDEAWVYAPASIMMHEQGPSLLPDVLPPDLSRGHPLLFHFLGALWMGIFGSSFVAVHSYVLFLSVCLLVFLYFFMIKFFSAAAGFVAVCLLALQPPFLLQSGVFLPEIQLSFFILLVFFSFLNGNRLLYLVFSTALLMTKETGLVFIAALGIWTLFENVYSREISYSELIKRLLFISSPVFIVATYFVVQKFMLGWYFFPEHISLFDFSWETFRWKYKMSYKFIFDVQGRKPLIVGLILLYTLLARDIAWYKRVLAAFFILASAKIFWGYWSLNDYLIFLLLPSMLFFIFYWMFVPVFRTAPIEGRLFSIIFIFGFCYMLFISSHFHASRYFTCLFPLFCIVVAGFSFRLLKEKIGYFYVLSVIAIVFTAYSTFVIDAKNFDDNLSYVEGIKVQQDMIGFAERNNLYSKNISTPFLIIDGLLNSYAGYRLDPKQQFTSVKGEITDSTEYIFIMSFEPGFDYEKVRNDSRFELAERYEHKMVWGEIYKRKDQD